MNEIDAECLKIPLVVGVTGHIDIAEEESYILDELGKLWDALRKIVGKDTPIVLLSSIAQGADHYIVKSRPEDVKYCVVLPFNQGDYEKDFVRYAQKTTALDEFRQDLEGAYKVVTCDAKVGDYSVASDYIRRRSDVFVTLWDGYESLNEDKSPKLGGTYHQMRTAFGMDELLIHHLEKAHLVINLTIHRKGKHKSYEGAFCQFPEDSRLNVIEHPCKGESLSITPLNDWLVKHFSNSSRKSGWGDFIRNLFTSGCVSESETKESPEIVGTLNCIRSHNESLTNVASKPLFENYLYKKLNNLQEKSQIRDAVWRDDFLRYAFFDAKAEKYQHLYQRHFFWIAVLCVVVGIIGQLWGGVNFSGNCEFKAHALLSLYLLGCFGAFLWGRHISRVNHYTQYVTPRAIAELMRLVIFWKLSGIQKSFVDCILRDSGIFWIALPICNWETMDKTEEEDMAYLKAGKGLATVKECWLEDQHRYYSMFLLDNPEKYFLPQQGEECRKYFPFSGKWWRKYRKKYERLDGILSFGKTFFTAVSFVLAVLLVVGYVVNHDYANDTWVGKYRGLIIGICPFLISTLGWVLEKERWGALGREYRKMRNYFEDAIYFMEQKKDDVVISQRVIQELMTFCYANNDDWKKIKNESKPEPMI